VVAPAVEVSEPQQAHLAMKIDGKSINAIRRFVGEVVLARGARTLEGNSLDWRHVDVRRTVMMLEESIRLFLATQAS